MIEKKYPPPFNNLKNFFFFPLFSQGMVGYYNNDLHSTMQPVDYDTEFCVDPLNCFIYVLNVGLRAGGGVGERN